MTFGNHIYQQKTFYYDNYYLFTSLPTTYIIYLYPDCQLHDGPFIYLFTISDSSPNTPPPIIYLFIVNDFTIHTPPPIIDEILI